MAGGYLVVVTAQNTDVAHHRSLDCIAAHSDHVPVHPLQESPLVFVLPGHGIAPLIGNFPCFMGAHLLEYVLANRLAIG
ncbi:hypothetical protein D3C76_1494060 [compost metagenome]